MAFMIPHGDDVEIDILMINVIILLLGNFIGLVLFE